MTFAKFCDHLRLLPLHTGRFFPSFERLRGKCFEDCTERIKCKQFTLSVESLKHLSHNLSNEGKNCPVQFHIQVAFLAELIKVTVNVIRSSSSTNTIQRRGPRLRRPPCLPSVSLALLLELLHETSSIVSLCLTTRNLNVFSSLFRYRRRTRRGLSDRLLLRPHPLRPRRRRRRQRQRKRRRHSKGIIHE